MAAAILTQEELKSQLHYDPETGIFTRIRIIPNSHAKIGDVAGSKSRTGYLMFMVNNRSYLSHRLAWLYMTGKFPDEEIDHINKNKADNRWANLRACSHAENLQNRPTQKNNVVGLAGTQFHPGTGKWRSRITVNRKLTSLGLFETAELAHQAYINAKREIHPFGTL